MVISEKTKVREKIGRSVRALLFFLVLFLLVSLVSEPLVALSSIDYHQISGFYEEPKNSLDAVYIGSSNCYVFWNSLHAWEEYGICVYPFASSSLPFYAVEHLIWECRKTQPDAVFIVNINTIIDQTVDYRQMHWLLDYMPFSLNKLELTHTLCQAGDIPLEQRMEFYFHIVRYHDRWNEFEWEDLERPDLWRKGVSMYSPYFSKQTNISHLYKATDNVTALSDQLTVYIQQLLDYCDQEQLPVVFVAVPQARASHREVGMLNAFAAIARERGYPVLDLLNDYEALGLDLKQDFYNEEHTNIHGSFKFTRYLSEYLIEHYGFSDKRENSQYASWHSSCETYYRNAAHYLLPFELDGGTRTELHSPASLSARAVSGSVLITWDGVSGAQRYSIFRKTAKTPWQACASVADCQYQDRDIVAGETYEYRVVPCIRSGGQWLYGSYQYAGVSVQP